ncbi:jg11310, partial [Pararge aegeria aegeria]
MVIHLNSDKPVHLRPYRTCNADRIIVRQMVNELLEAQIIQESKSAYASPALLVNKKNGEKRLCIDYRALNKLTIKDKYPMPRIEDLIDRLHGCTFFTNLDLKSGYYQIKMSEESIHKTAFITEDGHYEFLRLPFGLANAPSCFQQMMDKVVGNMRFGNIINYLDDILIVSETAEENLVLLEKVLYIFKENGLTLNLKKCNFLKKEIEFLGYRVNSEGVKPSETKVRAVNEFPTPKTVHQLRQFLGLISYFRKFIKNCAVVCSPLTKLLKKDTAWRWTSEHDSVFSTLKMTLTSEGILVLFDPNKENVLYTDASRDGIAGILMQVTEQGEKPVHYYSRQTTEDEKKYHSFELELLAIVQSLQKF